MEVFADFWFPGRKGRAVTMSPVQAATVALQSAGFDDIDIEPMGDHVRLTATGKQMSLTLKAETISAVCEKACEKVLFQ